MKTRTERKKIVLGPVCVLCGGKGGKRGPGKMKGKKKPGREEKSEWNYRGRSNTTTVYTHDTYLLPFHSRDTY